MRLIDVYPDRALNTPGAPATVWLEVSTESAAEAEVVLELRERDRVLACTRQDIGLTVGENRFALELPVPVLNDGGIPGGAIARARGYGLNAKLQGSNGDLSARTGALLAADHWRSVPRYGFFSDFPAGGIDPGRARELAKFHITAVQFYDWMYRHYRFLPPEDGFIDAMGRELSLATVAARVQECHAHGMAAIAYGAVYGAEPEFILQRPDWLLYDSAGQPLHLIERFYITDLRDGSEWREHIMREFEAAVHDVGFDGIHLDQYGFPKLAYDQAGELVEMGHDFRSVIDEAAARVATTDPDAGVIFNAVNAWPLDLVADSDQAAVYIEVWSPHDSYRDLVDLAQRTRDLADKQVILSAYLQPFHQGGAAAEWGARYISSVINSAGAHHLVLGEGNAVLREPYYPDYGQLSDEGLAVMRRYYDHSAANTHHLHAFDLEPVSTTFICGVNDNFVLRGAVSSAKPTAGAVWLSVKRRDGQFVFDLVNLTAVEDDSWNAPQPPAPVISDLVLEGSSFIRPRRTSWASPDDTLPASALEWELKPDGRLTLKLPALELWGTLVVDYG